MAKIDNADLEDKLVCVVGHRYEPKEQQLHMECIMKDGSNAWYPESDVQRAFNSAVVTYWAQQDEERPEAPGLHKIYGCTNEEEFIIQKRGCGIYTCDFQKELQAMKHEPLCQYFFDITYAQMPKNEVQRLHPALLEEWDTEKERSATLDEVQAIFSHRLNETEDSPYFELFCLRPSKKEWLKEAEVWKKHEVAVNTYWETADGGRKVTAWMNRIPHPLHADMELLEPSGRSFQQPLGIALPNQTT
jgi:hypothetical protein